MMRRWVLLLLPLGAALADPVGLASHDLGRLPQLRTGTAHLASSADPSGGNADRGHYRRKDGIESVLMEAKGAGQITRIWSANPQGNLRIYFDGESTPRVELPFAQLGQPNETTPTVLGYVSVAGGGVACWYPMPFSNGCRVTVEGAEQLYYQINYTTFPNQTVTSFTSGAFEPLGGMDWGAPAETAGTVAPGGSLTLFDRAGAATVRRLVIVADPASLAALRPLRVQMYWDDHPQPSVDAPLLDLFGAGLGSAQYLSAPLSVAGWDFFQFDFALPFRTRGRAVLLNQGSVPVRVEATAYLTAGRRDDDGYFHARSAQAETVAGQPFPLLAVTGRGHYVGTAVTLRGDTSLQYLEGDETVVVDGQQTLQGTGTEDYFDGAWFFRRGAFAEMFAGAPLLVCGKTALTAYRWHVADAIPFRRSLAVTLEHGPGNDAAGNLYRGVAYYYLAQPGSVPESKVPPAPPNCTASDPNAVIVEAESLASTAVAEGATVAAIDDAAAALRASGGQQLAVEFAAAGATVMLPLELPRTGLYDLALRLVDGGANFRLTATLDEQTVLPPPDQPNLGEERVRLGRARIKAGRHKLMLSAVADQAGEMLVGRLGIDTIELREVGRIDGAREAEDLPRKVSGDGRAVVQAYGEEPADAIRSFQVIGGEVPTEPVWSGGAQLRFAPAGAGQTCELTFTVEDTGDYGLAASFLQAPDTGVAELRLDGRTILARLETHRDYPVVGSLTPLGTHRLRAGDHRLTIRALEDDGAVQAIGIDYLLVDPAVRGHEGERLVQVNDLARGGVIKERFGAEPKWVGGAYIRFAIGAPTDAIELALQAPRSGRYQVTLQEARLPTGGPAMVTLGGATARFDCTAAGEARGTGVSFSAALRKGANPMVLRLAEDGAGDIAVDVIELEYLGDARSGAILGLVGGVLLLLLVTLAIRRIRRSV